MLDLQPIKDRLAAATPGPWTASPNVQPRGVAAVAQVNTVLVLSSGPLYGSPMQDASLIANAPTDLAALVAEVERLQAQLIELVDPKKAELVLFVDGAFTLRSEVFNTLLAGLVQMLDKAGAENYCQMEAVIGTRDAVVLTIQRKAGKTPHELRREAEAEVERLRGAIKQFGKDTDGAQRQRDLGAAYARLMAVLDA